MKAWLVGVSVVFVSSGCGLSDKVSEAQAQLDAAQVEYESFDLTCDFGDLSGQSEAETQATSAALTDESSCENAAEQYSVLVDQYDTDADGSLSDDELAEAEEGWEDAQMSLDADGDGKVSDDEKQAFRQKNPERKGKIQERFKESCAKKGKSELDCKDRRGKDKQRHLESLEGRFAEFDADGDKKLSPDEAKKLKETVKGERVQRRDEIKKGVDKDGDGKVGPAERQERRDQRGKGVPPPRPTGANVPPPPGGTTPPAADNKTPPAPGGTTPPASDAKMPPVPDNTMPPPPGGATPPVPDNTTPPPPGG